MSTPRLAPCSTPMSSVPARRPPSPSIRPGGSPLPASFHPEMTGTIAVRGLDGIVPEPSPQASAPSEAQAVVIDNRAFTPPALSVPLGMTVVWTNASDEPHTVTAKDGSFGSDILSPGETFSQTFDTEGTFAYACRLHDEMQAVIVVGSGAGAIGGAGRPFGERATPLTAARDQGAREEAGATDLTGRIRESGRPSSGRTRNRRCPPCHAHGRGTRCPSVRARWCSSWSYRRGRWPMSHRVTARQVVVAQTRGSHRQARVVAAPADRRRVAGELHRGDAGHRVGPVGSRDGDDRPLDGPAVGRRHRRRDSCGSCSGSRADGRSSPSTSHTACSASARRSVPRFQAMISLMRENLIRARSRKLLAYLPSGSSCEK